MDTPHPLPQPVSKTRRTHSPAFKAQVLRECRTPGTSVAAVARRHGLNANLIHKWKQAGVPAAPSAGFIAVPLPASSSGSTVLFELDHLKVHWPLSEIERAVPWLQALLK